MKNVSAAILIPIIGLMRQSMAEEDCQKEALAYVRANSNDSVEQRWVHNQEERFAQKQKDDASCSCDSKAADKMFFDWLADRKKKFDPPQGQVPQPLTPAERLEVCRWYLLYKAKGWTIDADIGDCITKSNFDSWIAKSPGR